MGLAPVSTGMQENPGKRAANRARSSGKAARAGGSRKRSHNLVGSRPLLVQAVQAVQAHAVSRSGPMPADTRPYWELLESAGLVLFAAHRAAARSTI